VIFANWIRTLIAAIAIAPAVLPAQATTTVQLQDPVYHDLDRLLGAGLVRAVLVGQKPYSRREIGRIIASARETANLSLSRIIERLRVEYAPEVERGLALNSVSVELLGTNSASRAIPADPTGSVAADLNPLLSQRAGRTYRPGLNAAAEGDASFRAADALVFHGRGRVLSVENAGENFTTGELLSGSGTLLWRNVALEVGRQQFVWGQGMEGGLLGSTSGRALDMARVANDTPFYAPSFLRHLGPLRGTLLVADLGRNQVFPGSYIIAYKLSGNPFTPRFEFGVSVLSEQGGHGAPSTTILDRFIDDIPLLQYTLPAGDKSHDQISNKFAGWEYRYRIPEWRGLQLYAEHQFDDMDPRRWKSTLWQDGGHIAGLSFAELGLDGRLSAAAEYHHTGLRYYTHTVFSSGLAFNRTLLGDPLGNQGNGGYMRLALDADGGNRLTLDAALERRGDDQYATTSDVVNGHESNFRFVLIKTNPAEWRQRIVGGWQVDEGRAWRTTLHGGYERVTNFGFVDGGRRNNFVGDVTVEWTR
jgi:hypothetical protein